MKKNLRLFTRALKAMSLSIISTVKSTVKIKFSVSDSLVTWSDWLQCYSELKDPFTYMRTTDLMLECQVTLCTVEKHCNHINRLIFIFIFSVNSLLKLSSGKSNNTCSTFPNFQINYKANPWELSPGTFCTISGFLWCNRTVIYIPASPDTRCSA